jgi:CP family cyanate transporter-like MFS transporter
MTDSASVQPMRQAFAAIALLWLSGVALRLTILAVPPVIPAIHDDLHLTQTGVGILTGLPAMLFAFAAVPGSLLIARLGAKAALVLGLAACAIGGALRGAVLDVGWLYTMTIIMGAGVAVMQVAMPPTVRLWQPQRIGFTTAVYTNGLLIGEILPVALMLPLVLPLVGGSWPKAFMFWSVPVAIIALLVLAFGPREANGTAATAARRRWWPDWRDGLIWRLGIMLGTANAMYFSANAFLPDFLKSIARTDLISPALTALNVGQLPASIILLAVAGRLERKAWPYAVSGALSALGVAAIISGNGTLIVTGAALLGFSAAGTLILALALPPLLAPPDDVHRVTAAMFTISYSCAVIVPVISGAIWDLTGNPPLAFVPILACGGFLIWLAPAITRVGQAGQNGPN